MKTIVFYVIYVSDDLGLKGRVETLLSPLHCSRLNEDRLLFGPVQDACVQHI
jgi:hypothetical protein